jgi:hypothetical protein
LHTLCSVSAQSALWVCVQVELQLAAATPVRCGCYGCVACVRPDTCENCKSKCNSLLTASLLVLTAGSEVEHGLNADCVCILISIQYYCNV